MPEGGLTNNIDGFWGNGEGLTNVIANEWTHQRGAAILTNAEWNFQTGAAILTNAEWNFQYGDAALTNWATLTEWDVQYGEANLTNWATLTEWDVQYGEANLTNWATLTEWDVQYGAAILTNAEWNFQTGAAVLTNAEWNFQTGAAILTNAEWNFQTGAAVLTNAEWNFQAGSAELTNLTTYTLTGYTNDLATKVLVTNIVTNWRLYQNTWIDSGAMLGGTNPPAIGSITNGTAAAVSDTWDFDDTTSEYVWFKMTMPDDWAGNGFFKMKIYCTTAAASGTSVWNVVAGAIGNDDPMGPTIGTTFALTNIVTVADDLMVTAGTEIGIGGTPVLGDLIYFRIARAINAAYWFPGGDTKLLGVSIQYKLLTTETAVW